jgi:hypothetical protein
MNLKKEQNMYTVLLIVGIVILIGGTVLVKAIEFDNLIGVISGLGGAWIGISSIKLYQIKKKPKKYKEQIIGQSDERSITIRGYAGHATFVTTLLAISIMSLIFMFLDYTLPLIIGAGLLLIHIVSFLIFARYYEKKL